MIFKALVQFQRNPVDESSSKGRHDECTMDRGFSKVQERHSVCTMLRRKYSS
jgi:hypothetical protein